MEDLARETEIAVKVMVSMERAPQDYPEREIKWLVIHCSATKCTMPFSLEQLRACHLRRGFSDIGYHFYITREGIVQQGRPLWQVGAHAVGFNRNSIGICYEGGLDAQGQPADTRTNRQKLALLDLLSLLKREYPDAVIVGHRELSADVHKACPCFEAQKEYREVME